jgi:mRNA interferase RelE/StbE
MSASQLEREPAMTESLPLSSFRVQFDALCENPHELIVTEQGEPVFTLLPYGMYQSLIETLDIVADAEALASLQDNLAMLKAGKPLKVHSIAPSKGEFLVGLTESAYQVFRDLNDTDAQNDLQLSILMLSTEPETQGKALVGSLKGYRSIKVPGEGYQIIYFVEKSQVVVVFVHVAVVQPNALLVHLLKSS